ncbi:MAG: NAD(P)/FAD-dependent oxidoreductase [Actinomycetota bacterium]
MEHHDVAVIGAGLAGLQCARRLSARGRRVLLVERKPSVDVAVHTTGIFVRRTLEDFELPPGVLGPPVRRVVLYSPGRRSLVLDGARDEFRVGRMQLLYSKLLEGCIEAGARWRSRTRFLGCEPSDGGSIVRLSSTTGPHEVHARLLVGADGASSHVARALDLSVNRRWIVGVEDVFENVPLDGAPAFHCFLDPVVAPGYLAWVVNDGEQAHVGVGGYPARFDAARALERFECTLDDVVDLGAAEWIERRGGRIPVGGVLSRIACPAGLLVGDAAGAPSPLTAGGLDPCMRLSSFAAEVADAFLATGDADALGAYSGARFRARFATRLGMRRGFDIMSGARGLELAWGLLRYRPFERVARRVLFGEGSFPDPPTRFVESPLVSPERERSRSARRD